MDTTPTYRAAEAQQGAYRKGEYRAMTDRQEARKRGEATRKANAEARRAARAAQWEQEQKDKAIVADAMRGILSTQGATPRERIFAVLTLDHIATGSLVPWRANQLYNEDVDIEAFKTALDAIREKQRQDTAT